MNVSFLFYYKAEYEIEHSVKDHTDFLIIENSFKKGIILVTAHSV